MHHHFTDNLKNGFRSLKWNWLWCAVIVLGLSAHATTVSAQQTLFIGDFILQEDQWDFWHEQGTVLHVEGRYHSITGKILKMQNCDLNFRAGSSVRFTNTTSESRQVRMTGVLKTHGDTYEFQADNFLHLPELSQQINNRLSEEGKISEVTLYSLAQKVRDQADFYDDAKLKSEAAILLKQAIVAERATFIGDNPDSLYRLANKAKQLGAPPSLWEPMLHETLRKRFDRLKDRGQEEKALGELLEQVSRLPGAKVVLPQFDAEQEARYRSSPLKVYERADAFTRLELNRLFYIEMVENSILKRLNVDKSNGIQIAGELVTFIPERAKSEQVKDLEMAGLNFKFQHIETATRSEMLELWEAFRALKQKEKATQVVSRWVKKREERISEEGPAGAPQLADDIVQFLNDKPRALKLLLAAVKELPGSPEITSRLEILGLIKVDDKWVDEKEYRARLDRDPLRKAMRQGVVIEGMTLNQVRRTLGTPTQHIRAASKNGITEIWVYPQGDGRFLSVFFERKQNKPRQEALVKKIEQPE